MDELYEEIQENHITQKKNDSRPGAQSRRKKGDKKSGDDPNINYSESEYVPKELFENEIENLREEMVELQDQQRAAQEEFQSEFSQMKVLLQQILSNQQKANIQPGNHGDQIIRPEFIE